MNDAIREGDYVVARYGPNSGWVRNTTVVNGETRYMVAVAPAEGASHAYVDLGEQEIERVHPDPQREP